jgi:hypothetical protein
MEQVLACRPNISPRGRRLRRGFGVVMAMIALGMLAAFIVWHVWWPVRALVFFPMQYAGYGFFQASRNTCLARAKEGMFEHDDMSKTPAPADEVEASRRVARGIGRDSALLGLAGALVGVASALCCSSLR